MAWRPAKSVYTLKTQLDVAYPGWTFLGFKGDDRHASVPSDHNPNAQGVVCALDIGPGGKLEIHKLADNIVAKPHSNLKYIISKGRIAEWQYGFKWRAYGGRDPHDTHIHVSVGRGPDGQSVQPYDSTVKWNIGVIDMPTEGNINTIIRRAVDRPPTSAELSKYSKLPWADFVKYVDEVAAKRQRAAAAKLAETEAKLASCQADAKTLSPGKYLVK